MDFWVAFAAGVVVLWMFARDQFNKPSWKDDHRLTRILSVPQMRGARVRNRALAFYLFLLVFTYVVFVYLLAAGAVTMGGTPTSSESNLAMPGAWVPLTISLAMVGFAPRIEILSKLEERIRVAAHEIMGLPRGLFTAGERIADTELTLAQIGPQSVVPDDVRRLDHQVKAAGQVFGRESPKVARLENRLLKLMAYKVWVRDGIWPTSTVRKPYEVLEGEFATEVKADLDDLDDLSNVSQTGMDPDERDTLRKRWNDRLAATEDLCGEICALLFIYSERKDPAEGREIDPARSNIAAFFDRARERRTTVPELGILIDSIVWATVIALVWGYVAGVFGPTFGLRTNENPAMEALTTGLSALFLYGPALLAAIWWYGRSDGSPFTTGQALWTFALCVVASLVCLMALNIGSTALDPGFPRDKLPAVTYWAFRRETPMAVLGAAQGVFVNLFLRAGPEASPRKWMLLALNVMTLMLLAVVATQLIVPAGTGRLPDRADYAVRLVVAGLMGLTIGLAMISATRPKRKAPRKGAFANTPA